MGTPKVVIGRLLDDRLIFKPVAISKTAYWLKWLDSDELVEFTADLLKLVEQIAKGRKNSTELALFLSEWRETALLNQETDVLRDIMEAEEELNSGRGKDWTLLKKEVGL
ncbi:hypothetical protein FJZ31_05855 [Candidatus Poribacteria bacterium]|nr:hypothetical protein [Candidatus Poribacteria bacterium]